MFIPDGCQSSSSGTQRPRPRWAFSLQPQLTTFILGYCILLYLFPSFQHPGVLADPRHVLHHPLLHHYEETDQGIGFI